MNTLEEHYLSDEQIADIVQDISDRMKFPVFGAGGGFAPIGTVAYFDGTQAPVGWLLCNGGTHNITDYPELAAYFASHHGRSNYYGGNGTTTFGVPLQKGMPNNEDVNHNTSEHIVGVWTDGKPLYEKTISFGALPNATTKSVAHGISNLSSVIKLHGVAYRSSDNKYWSLSQANPNGLASQVALQADNTNIIIVTGDDRRAVTAYVTLQYTKTTDSAVAAGHSADGKGVFCIKATVAGDPNGHVYSTEEHVVGQWIDGKPLYEKTVTGTTASTLKDWTTIANLGTNCVIVKVDGYVTITAGQFPIDYISDNDQMAYCMNFNSNGIFAHSVIKGSAFLSKSITVTLQYTK